MELLEGETLRQRLKDGALPARKAVEVAMAIAGGLAAAHDKGVVHRDLKPENVFLLASGQVKVLDFGLARMDPVASEGQDVPTISLSTEPGRVMGTVGYMAPEQVRGRAVDARADIFAFGAVLYEMLTGKRAFQGESPVETLNAILKEDPPSLFESSKAVSPALERIVRRCLEKRPEERFRTAHDLGIALDAISTSSTRSFTAEAVEAGLSGKEPRPRRRLLEGAALLLAGVATGALGVRLWPRIVPPPVDGAAVFRWASFSGRDASPTVSPDGRTIAFTSDRDGQPRIWLKQVSGEAEAPLTSGPDDLPRFSPDGTQVLFARPDGTGTSLYRAAVLGGEARRLVEGAAEGDWSPDGRRVAFLRLQSEGGQTVTSVLVSATDGSDAREVAKVPGGMRAPRFSPDGATIAIVPVPGALLAGAQQGVVLVGVGDGEVRTVPAPDARRVISAAAWTAAGELVYLQAESVVSAAGSTAILVRQDPASGRVLAQAWSPSSALVLDALGDGRVVFDTRSPRQNLREVTLAGGPADGRWLSRGESTDRQPVYSPDGQWVAFSSNRGGGMNLWLVSPGSGRLRRVTDAHVNWDPAFTRDGRGLLWSSNRGGNFEVWTADVEGGAPRQVTRDGGNAENPTATPDGQWVVYSSGNPEKAGLWKIHPDGTGAVQLVKGRVSLPDVSPDGRHALYRVFSGKYPAVLKVVRVDDGKPEPFEIAVEARRRTTVTLGRARWMPDGKAIAFVGQDETGASGVYVQDFAPGRDTAASRRKLAGFDPDVAAESFGVAPDGSRLVVAGWVQLFSLMEAERLPGLLAPPRGARP
jgi:Tol biopolymer transport system component